MPTRRTRGKAAPSMLDDYLTVAELAAALRVHEMTIHRWSRTGVGPPRTQIGGRVLYRRASVEAWLAEQEQHA